MPLISRRAPVTCTTPSTRTFCCGATWTTWSRTRPSNRGTSSRAVFVEAGANDAGVPRLMMCLQAGVHRPRIRALAFLLVDEREHFVRDGRAVVVVAALEQEHGVEGLARRLTLAHAGGHRLAGGFGGSGGGGSAATEKAGNEREESGQEELAAAART